MILNCTATGNHHLELGCQGALKNIHDDNTELLLTEEGCPQPKGYRIWKELKVSNKPPALFLKACL